MNWEQYIWGIIAAAIIIPLLSVAMKRIIHWFKTDKTEILLNVPEKALNTGTKFGLLHVRDGKDEVSDRGELSNKIHWFKKVDQQGNLKISMRYTRNLGFQFKCFADYKEISFGQLKEMLEEKGYLHVTRGEGKAERIWFILPDYPSCKTLDKIENNFIYPE